MTPLTPFDAEYVTGSSVYCPLLVAFLFSATFVYVASNTNSLHELVAGEAVREAAWDAVTTTWLQSITRQHPHSSLKLDVSLH